MVAIQAVVELLQMVPASVWIGLILVIALVIVLMVITSKRRSREVEELDKLFADTGDSFDQPLAPRRRQRKNSGDRKVQEAEQEKQEIGGNPAHAEPKADLTEKNEIGDETHKDA